MISELYSVFTKDKFPKVLRTFRLLHLREMIVLCQKTGNLEGIITRQDIF